MVNYLFAASPELPPLPPCLYQYVAGGNGVFVRAERPGLSVVLPVTFLLSALRGLAPINPRFNLIERVEAGFVLDMLNLSRQAAPREMLFYLVRRSAWNLIIPSQVMSSGSVRPNDPFNPNAREALIEVHSHHSMGAFFSATDDRDETGFRIYAVLGRIFDRPTLSVRVGVYGHFWQIPAGWVFNLPDGIRDRLKADDVEEGDAYRYDPID